jgi:hypothetical protein
MNLVDVFLFVKEIDVVSKVLHQDKEGHGYLLEMLLLNLLQTFLKEMLLNEISKSLSGWSELTRLLVLIDKLVL